MTSALPVSSIYVVIAAVLVVVLLLRVAKLRNARKIGIGDGGDKSLSRAIRVHANAVETIPIALLLLVMLELSGATSGGLHGLGSGLIVARLLHAHGLTSSSGYSFGRFFGTLLTLLIIPLMCGWLLYLNYA